MNKEFDVSLVITTYNEEKYFPILVDSIEKQNTSLNMEVIVVDDGSTDKTLELVDKYRTVQNRTGYIKYELIHNDKPHDVQYMRNLGLQHALGKTIIFCDADVALSANYIERMVLPIISGKVDTMLCKTYAVLEGFYNIRPEKYSKSYDFYLKYAPKFMLKRFPVQLVPWLKRWFNKMKDNKKYVSIWTIPNRAHTTAICTKTSIAREAGGWRVRIGAGDDAKYSWDIFRKSGGKILFDRKSILYISRRRVFPHDISWIIPKIFRKKFINDYSKSVR